MPHRLEFATPHVALALEPPSLVSTSFVPARIAWQQHSTLSYAPASGDSTLTLPPSASASASSHSDPRAEERLTFEATNVLSVKGIQLEVLDVGYFARYKTGIPCLGDITERGLLDLHFGGETAREEDGLGFDLTLMTPAPPGADGETAAAASPAVPPLFRVDHSRTAVRLDSFRLEPHQSSHPWLMWFFGPLLRKAVRTVIETELKDKVLEAGAEWVAQRGGEIKRRKEDLAREETASVGGTGSEPEPGPAGWDRGGVWSWIRASWDVFVARQGATELDDAEPREQPVSDEDDVDRTIRVHLTSHGVTAEVDELEATVGVGTEGIVLPEGEAGIPLPAGRMPKKGLVRAAEDQAAQEVQEGREAAEAAVKVLGGAVGASQEWRAAAGLAAATTWRSSAFDV